MQTPTAPPSLTRPLTGPITIGMLVLPAFNSMAVNAFLDPFRAANYLQGQSLYRWHLLSLAGGPVVASNGLALGTTEPYAEVKIDFDYLVVNASWTPENFQHKALQQWLRRMAMRGTTLVGIDTGAFVLAFAGLMHGYRAVVHYEHIDSFREFFPQIEVIENLYTMDRHRISCSGGAAAIDLALELIRQRHGMSLANATARYIFQPRLRGSGEKQLPHLREPTHSTLPETLRNVLRLIEQSLEELVSIPDLAHKCGLSQRQLERLFRKHIGLTPKRYYLNIRLNRARGLLTQTELSIAEIASACGFNSTAHFTRAYKRYFEIAPSLDRHQGRIPFQFRPISPAPYPPQTS